MCGDIGKENFIVCETHWNADDTDNTDNTDLIITKLLCSLLYAFVPLWQKVIGVIFFNLCNPILHGHYRTEELNAFAVKRIGIFYTTYVENYCSTYFAQVHCARYKFAALY